MFDKERCRAILAAGFYFEERTYNHSFQTVFSDKESEMLFPFGAILFFAYLICGFCACVVFPWDKWNIPGKLCDLLAFIMIITGPLFLIFIALWHFYGNMVSVVKIAETRREKALIDAVNFSGEDSLFAGGNSDPHLGSAVNAAKRMIRQAIDRRCSDIFIDPQPAGDYVIRMRIDGGVRQTGTLDGALAKKVLSTLKVISRMDISEHRRPQDGSFSADIDGELLSFRVATVGAYAGEKMSIRILGSSAGPRSLKDLDMDADDLEIIERAIKLPSGLVLVCGPTGSGKTTSLYAMLKSIDFSLKNVISIEDPIENIIPQISQMEVNPKAGISFAQLLRNSLRQNPDVICLGEIRDEETAGIAVRAAQTGHLIIATLHSNDNLGTVDRLQNLGVPLRTIAGALHVIISQRLVRTLCPHCKKQVALPAEYVEYFDAVGFPKDKIYVPGGCPECDGTGFSGRRGIFDIMVINSQLRQLLEAEGATLSSIQEYINSEYGSSMMAYKGFRLVAAGITSIDEVNRVAMDMG